MSLRLRWILTLLGFGALLIAGGRLLTGSGTSSQGSAAALLRANRRTRALIARDERPRSAPLPDRARPRLALEREIGADLRRRLDRRQLPGPFRRVRCTRVPLRSPRPLRFRCTAMAGKVPYPYLGVADTQRRVMTWCKFDPAPAGVGAVPVSRRCRR